MVFRAIKLNIKLFRWERALMLAQQYKQHIETVLWYRRRYVYSPAIALRCGARPASFMPLSWLCCTSRYLAAANGEESIPSFQELQDQVPLDEQLIKQRVLEEKAKEAQRPGAKRYV